MPSITSFFHLRPEEISQRQKELKIENLMDYVC